MEIFGQTRSRVTSHYALITSDTHVHSPLIGWTDSDCVMHISPEMGARFSQYTATMQPGGKSSIQESNLQRFVYVKSGSCRIGTSEPITTGGYAWIPPKSGRQITALETTTLIVFDKRYINHRNDPTPKLVIGDAANVKGEPFMGDEDAKLQTLLPIEPAFDMAVNIFTYQSGATLPQVEIHTMEHGLLMLSGQGVYRLGEDYFPVAAGDVIWMASYCPQWFVAMGKQPASYIYYKDIHRDALNNQS